MSEKLVLESKEKIENKIKNIDRDIKSLEESSLSEYVNEGIINQVRLRIEQLKLEKKDLENTYKNNY